jgi:hypothetical protein
LNSELRAASGGRDVAWIAVLIIVAALALAQSWNRWLDPIIDTGRDLYIPDQLTHGAKLYRDMRYQYPPLAPYLLAAITSVLGHSLLSYTIIGIGQSLIIGAGLWLTLRRAAGELAAFVATLFFIALSFTGASTWGANFVFPYAYGATLGMMFLVAALTAFVFERDLLAIAALVAASWCKVEYAAGAMLIVVVLLLARRLRVRAAVMFFAAMALTFAVAAVFFRDSHWIRENVFAATLTRGAIAHRFFSIVSGTAEWPKHLALAILGALAIALVSYAFRMSIVVAGVAVVASLFLTLNDAFFRGWGLLQIIALVAGVRRRSSPLIFFAVFSIASTLRVPLNVTPAWYGSVLVVPLYALIAYVLFAELPLHGVRSALWLPLLAAFCVRDLVLQHQRYALKAFPIESARGVFLDANRDRAKVLNELIRTVRAGTLAVMPEGITLNYLTKTTTSLTFQTFTPPETADPGIESAVIGELERRPPDRVAIVSRDVQEYGYYAFGLDYDRRLAAYLFAHYEVERRWSTPRFDAVLLARRK